MKRRILAVFAAAGLVLALRTAASAMAMGSLTLRLEREGTPVPDALVAVYRAGTAVTGGYRLTEGFGGGFINEADVLDPQLPQWMAGEAGEQALRQRTDHKGEVYFGPLDEGLYLVIQEDGSDRFEPFLLILPWDGSVWDILAAPKLASVPDTSDPGTLTRYGWSMLGSGLGMVLLSLKAGEKNRKCL